jgi:protein-S-isoprenylcysteine O-methyltransferase Ste14
MNITFSTFAGCLAFFLMACIDWAMQHDYPRLKPLFLLGACAFFSVGLWGILSFPDGEPSNAWIKIPGWICIFLFGSLLIYSIFIEIPLKSTYLDSHESQVLINTGTYALSRHPGVLWFAGFILGLYLIRPSAITVLAGGIWLLSDVFLVAVEDQYFFPRMIPGYTSYKATTPFLWPTRESFSRFISSFSAHGGSNH